MKLTTRHPSLDKVNVKSTAPKRKNRDKIPIKLFNAEDKNDIEQGSLVINIPQNDIDEFADVKARGVLSLDYSERNEDGTTLFVDKKLYLDKIRNVNPTGIHPVWVEMKSTIKEEAIVKMKYTIRKGIPPNHISQVWFVITGGYESMITSPKLYFRNLNSLFGNDIPGQISKYPTFGGTLCLSNHILKSYSSIVVKRLLCVFGMNFPRLNFVPPMPDLISLFLYYLKEEETFFAVNEILKDLLKSRKHLVYNRVGWSTVMLVFDELVKIHLPKVWSLMTKRLNMTSTKAFSERWFFRLFIEDLPIHIVLRFFGSYLCEGLTILFKVGLAILKTHKSSFMECTTEEEFIKTLKEASLKTHDVDQFFKTSFSYKVSKVVRKSFQKPPQQTPNLFQTPSDGVNTIYCRPEILQPSSIASYEDWEEIYEWIPLDLRIKNPQLLFTTSNDGFSLNYIYSKIGESTPTILFVKSGEQRGFGAFIKGQWKRKKNDISVNTRECFLFTLTPERKKFSWVDGSEDSFFIFPHSSYLNIGRGYHGFGLNINSDGVGSSCKVSSFENELLNGEDSESFICKTIEVYGFK